MALPPCRPEGDHVDLDRLLSEEVPCERVPELLRRARASLPGPDSSKLRQAVALSNLSQAHLAAYRCTGEVSHWEDSVDAARQALGLVPEGRAERRTLSGNLAGCLSYGRAVGDQEEAIELWQETMRGLREGSTQHAELLGRIGQAHVALHELRHRPEDLERGLDHLERALGSARLPDVERAPLTMGLAAALLERCRRVSGDPADAVRAVDLLEELERTDGASTVVGLADALAVNLEAARQEVVRTGADPAALDTVPEPAAGESGTRLLPGLASSGLPAQLAATRSAMSMALSGRLSEADRAIALADRHLGDMAPDDPSRAPMLCDAAHHLLARAHHRRRAQPQLADQDVREALDGAREAHRVAVGVHVAGAAVMLAQCLTQRYAETADRSARDLDEAIGLLEGVLRSPGRRPDIVPPARHRYAEALLLRGIRDGSAEDFTRALELRATDAERLRKGTPKRAFAEAGLAQMLHIRAASTGSSDDWAEASNRSRQVVRTLAAITPTTALDAARTWADRAWEGHRPREAAEAYGWLLQLLHRVAITQTTRADKETVLVEAATAGQRAAPVHTAAGRFQDAAVVLETARAVILAESLDRERFAVGTLRTARPDLAARYERAMLRLEQATQAYDEAGA
ncbi:hypothetical protein [Streptomyces cahuitamycinicus]|uniref:hypothetical protein n=1 Tax=Streptomyces cahuitamycinicus TaxID=2070367 RepID=UPI0011AF4556|nr:hypothetical protein [Streptomyces cahuitamycinicus]